MVTDDKASSLVRLCRVAVPAWGDFCGIALFDGDGKARLAASHAVPGMSRAETERLERLATAPWTAQRSGDDGIERALIGTIERPLGALTLATRGSGGDVARSGAERTRAIEDLCQLALAAATVTEPLRHGLSALQGGNLARLLDASPAVVHILDSDGRYVFVNRLWEETFRRPRESIYGKTLHDLWPRETADFLMSQVRRVITSGKPEGFEHVLQAPDGPHTYLTVRGPLTDDLERPLGVFGVSTDITERKAMESTLKQSEMRFRTMFELSPVPIIIARFADGRFVDVNQAAEKLTGFSRQEMVGRTGQEIGIWKEPSTRDQRLAPLVRGETIRNFEAEIRCKDGSIRHGLITIGRMQIADEDCTVTIGLDVSERRAVESALRESEQRFRKLFDLSPGPIVISRQSDWVLLFVNRAAVELTGYSREELIGRSAADIGLWSAADVAALRVADLSPGDAGRSLELDIRRKNGETRQLLVRFDFLEIDGEPCTMTLGMDITDFKRLEAQLLQSSKMEAIGRLAGGVAHDFNNILTTVQGYAEVLLDRMPASDPNRRNVDIIHRSAVRGGELTRQLLVFGRRQPMRPAATDVNSLVRSMVAMLERLVGEDVAVICKLDDAVPSVTVDPAFLEQVVFNLVANARDAMPTGGRLWIETGLSVHAERGSLVRLTIRDEGIGMTPETVSRIFEPFFTTKEIGRGSGLGLSSVYSIVDQSGGTIEVESAPGKGSSFHVLLPASSEAASHDERNDAQTKRPPTGGETVLLVEDDADVRDFVAEILESSGYHVLRAGSGSEAIEVSRGRPDRIDLLLTDVIMPGMSGHEVAERLRADRPALKVLLMSGYPGERATSGAPPDITLLPKPFSMNDLLGAIRRQLD